MKAPVCDLCGSKEFTKEEGMFVCQSCGTKYTLEEAKKLVKEIPETAGAAVALQAGAMIKDLISAAEAAKEATAFKPESVLGDAKGALDINNYICKGWESLIDDYKAVEHPTAEQQEQLVEQAKSCLTALNGAAAQGSVNHVQAALIYDNCREIVQSVKNTSFYTQNEDGSWKRNSLPFGTDFKVAGVTESWDRLYEKHVAVLEQAYVDAHPEEAQQKAALEAQAAQLQAELDDLKDEKRSHGFFDFSGKREVKERMAPIKDELSALRRQISDIDDRAENYAEECIKQLEGTFARLDF